MDLTNFQPINPDAEERLVEQLDDLLTNYEVYHNNIRKIHWAPELRPFLDLNEKVTFLYNVTRGTRDELAESITARGYLPSVAPEQPSYLPVQTSIQALQEIPQFEEAVFHLVRSSKELLSQVKEILILATELNDQRTQALMTNLAHQLSLTNIVFSSVRLAQLN